MGSEKDFENKVKNFLSANGCWWLKTWSNGIQREGVPDLLVCCNRYFIGIELKAEGNHASPLQKREIQLIRKACGIAMVLYPSQFDQFKEVIYKLNQCNHTDVWLNQAEVFERC